MILHTNADFYIVAKPSGLGMHTEGDTLGIIALLEAQTAESLYPVHRLDKETSGLLIVARSSEAASIFGRLFETREIEKFYIAIGGNKPKKKQGMIQGDMAKGRNGNWLLKTSQDNPARTQFFSHGTGTGARLYILKPLTGKTHQLRVALKSISAPILGDKRYGGAPAERLMLHAMSLRFTWKDEWMEFLLPPSAQADFAPLDWSQFPSLTTPWEYDWPVVHS